MQSVRSDLREMELFETLTSLCWDVLFLSETWRDDREEIWETDEGHMFLGSGWGGARRGVAIMIHSRHRNGFKQFKAINERLCAVDLHFDGNRVRLISVYMPDSSYDDADVEAIYILIDTLI